MHRENQLHNEAKKAADENKRINEKVRKLMEKNDKNEFKNFTLMTPQPAPLNHLSSKEEYCTALSKKFSEEEARIKKQVVTMQEWIT